MLHFRILLISAISLITLNSMAQENIYSFKVKALDGSEIDFSTFKGKKILIVGDILHSRVALSNIFCLQKLGAEVRVCGPATLIPKHIEALGVKVMMNLKEALMWCDVANMLRIQLERHSRN